MNALALAVCNRMDWLPPVQRAVGVVGSMDVDDLKGTAVGFIPVDRLVVVGKFCLVSLGLVSLDSAFWPLQMLP